MVVHLRIWIQRSSNSLFPETGVAALYTPDIEAAAVDSREFGRTLPMRSASAPRLRPDGAATPEGQVALEMSMMPEVGVAPEVGMAPEARTAPELGATSTSEINKSGICNVAFVDDEHIYEVVS